MGRSYQHWSVLGWPSAASVAASAPVVIIHSRRLISISAFLVVIIISGKRMTGLLDRLEEWKKRFGASDTGELKRLLAEASGRQFSDADSLIRLHECLLFLRAYPADAEVIRLADGILFSFAQRAPGVKDLSPFENAEISGIAGTSFSAVFSYEVARQLAARYPRDIEIDWENLESTDKLGAVLRRIVPLV